MGAAHTSPYGATKAALHSLTKSWAAEFGPRGVRVNGVAPGPVLTDENQDRTQVLRQLTAGARPAG